MQWTSWGTIQPFRLFYIPKFGATQELQLSSKCAPAEATEYHSRRVYLKLKGPENYAQDVDQYLLVRMF